MPSSHSALVTGACAGIGWELGFADPLFALPAPCAVHRHVRRQRRAPGRRSAGRRGSMPCPPALWDTRATAQPAAARLLRPLKENLGHTRLEVLAGSLIGPRRSPCRAGPGGLAAADRPGRGAGCRWRERTHPCPELTQRRRRQRLRGLAGGPGRRCAVRAERLCRHRQDFPVDALPGRRRSGRSLLDRGGPHPQGGGRAAPSPRPGGTAPHLVPLHPPPAAAAEAAAARGTGRSARRPSRPPWRWSTWGWC